MSKYSLLNQGHMTKKMDKIMKFVNLQFWEQLFKTLRKVFFRNKSNILEYHILDSIIKGKQHTAENIKKLISHKNSVTIQNAAWQKNHGT
jgi:putative heme degradation protein